MISELGLDANQAGRVSTLARSARTSVVCAFAGVLHWRPMSEALTVLPARGRRRGRHHGRAGGGSELQGKGIGVIRLRGGG